MPKVIDDKNVYRSVIDVLVTHGYESATTLKIAETAGIHEATLFRKYGSKLNLVRLAIQAHFQDVPFAKVTYTGDLQTDLNAILQAYLETSELVGDILPILLVEIPRNPELKDALETPWKNILQVSDILAQYQAQGVLRKEPVLNSITILIGPLMARHMIENADPNISIPPMELQEYIDGFLHGRLITAP